MSYLSQRRSAYGVAAFPALVFLSIQVLLLGSALQSAFVDSGGNFTLSNFARVFSDPLFQRGARFNVLVPVFSVVLEVMLGLFMALWFYHIRRGKTVWRTVAIVPFALPEIVYLLTMKLLFRQHGYLNSALVTLGGNESAVGWLEPGSWLTVLVIVLVDAWRVTPLVFLIVLAALEQMPESYLEAARVDGGTWWQVTRFVQIPLVIPALAVALSLRAIDAFRIFTTPLVLVGVDGLPVLTSVAYHYKVDLNDLPAANVAALTLALGLLAGAVLILLIWRRRGTR